MSANTIESTTNSLILALNGGSSSIKCGLFTASSSPACLRRVTIDRIGRDKPVLTDSDPQSGEPREEACRASNYAEAIDSLLSWLAERIAPGRVAAVGHRVVHGMERTQPEPIDPSLIAQLRDIQCYDPDHLPGEIALIEACSRVWPRLPQIACFDTAFHSAMPGVARLLPLPRRFAQQGVRRYGFHGLSFAYLMEELASLAGSAAARGRVVLAHLGSGASLAAVRDGQSIDTTMGFTPSAGLVMGTRAGDLDPGAAWYVLQSEGMTPEDFNRLINHESGLLGLSETSSDMRDLLHREPSDPRAAEAVALFCYQARKWIGAMVAALGGLDTLVFSGGIGEHSHEVRRRIADGLEHLGVELEDSANREHAAIISRDGATATVRVIPTDEECMIARAVLRHLSETGTREVALSGQNP